MARYRDDGLPLSPASPRTRHTHDRYRYRFVQMLGAMLTSAAFFALFALGPAWPLDGRAPAPQTTLRFTQQGTFQITVFEDLHFGENAWDQWGPQQDVNSVRVMNEVLDAERPQLVVLNGDLITGENAFRQNATAVIDEIAGPLVRRGLPWASTYGNHDSDFNLSRQAILAHERRYPNALTTQMVRGRDAGVSNYWLPVYPAGGGDVPAAILWFFDSRGGFLYQQRDASGGKVGQANWVDASVVEWFTSTAAQLARRYGATIPSVAFVHIPTNASQALQTEAVVDPRRQPGINDDYVLAGQAQGWCADGSNPPDGSCPYGGQDVPFMRALAATPGLAAVFSGHDHGDTWCYRWEGVLPGMSVDGGGLGVCFGQHSGYGGYGTWTRGARQILLSERDLQRRELDTWIRLESGDVVGSVRLNATYNRDLYPATPDTHTSCPTCVYR